MKTCYIFGAAEGRPQNFNKKSDDLIIAADAGYVLTEKLGIKADIILGDFDSLGFVPEAEEIIKHPVKKDDTDMLLAVKTGLHRGFKRFVIYGGVGGRIDHTFANFQTLSFIVSNGGVCFLCGDDFTALALSSGSVKFSDIANGAISIFSATTDCEVTERNLLYGLEKEKVTFDFPLGVSNEFIGKEAEITVHKGTAYIIWQGPADWVL